MYCPKDRKVALIDSKLTDTLSGKACPDCKGTWIPAEQYEAWQANQSGLSEEGEDVFPETLDVEFVQSPFDAKGGLCPDCRHYLSRARVGLKTPFYVERCLACGGIWCDYGEWDVLEKLGLHTSIQRLFSSEWQTKARERELLSQERKAMINKLGQELADRVFEMADILQNHPNGDFGVAYLMRRFDRPMKLEDKEKEQESQQHD